MYDSTQEDLIWTLFATGLDTGSKERKTDNTGFVEPVAFGKLGFKVVDTRLESGLIYDYNCSESSQRAL